jgi:hypothetical protein
MRSISFLVLIGLISVSCQEKRVVEKRYLDLDSLMNAQVAILSKSKVSLTKKAVIGLKKDSSITVPDSSAWSQELDVFRQLDLINRPIYRDVYQINDKMKDSKSNLLIYSLEARSKSPIPYLRLYYQDTPSRLKKLEAVYQESNSLYASHRLLKMYFDDTTGRPSLTGYLIEGDQKMILSDSIHYTITAHITF